LGSTGARKEALKLLIEKLQSVSGAIDFIQSEDPKDSELWEYLIVECLKFPERISELLEHVGGAEYVEPIKLIRRIPEGRLLILFFLVFQILFFFVKKV
jgi:hypothetical protein